MQYRMLGKTGLTVSEVSFGGIPIIRLSVGEAVSVLHRAFDRGINFYDTANAYRDSEHKMGRAFRDRRDRVILATKTGRRDGAGALEHLENSLRMLETDYIDLYQLHQVAQEKDWEAAAAPGGALEVVRKAQAEGKVRHIGVTSHSLPMAIKLVRTGLFATVQFPFNFIEDAAKDELFPAALERGMGILAMKPFAGGVLDNASLVFKFLRQYPDAIPIPGFDSPQAVDEIVGLYAGPNSVGADDLALMDRYRAELGQRFCRRCEYCLPCPNGVAITGAMGYRVTVARLSPKGAVGFSGRFMDTVANCTQCGLCATRCPYELDIPAILKQHYDLYETHRALD